MTDVILNFVGKSVGGLIKSGGGTGPVKPGNLLVMQGANSREDETDL